MTELAAIAQTVAIISACWAIFSGIGAWKREFIGKRRIEIAEQVLAKFFEVRDAIAFIRNPFSSTEEGKSRKRAEGESPEESQILDQGYVVVERYTKKENVFAEFNTLKYRFMAVFGRQTEELFIGTNKILKSCSSAPTKSLIPSSPLPECSLVSIGEATDGTTCDVKNFGNASLVNRRLTKRYFGTRVPCQTKS